MADYKLHFKKMSTVIVIIRLDCHFVNCFVNGKMIVHDKYKKLPSP